VELINFDSLNLDVKRRKKDGAFSRRVNLNGSKFTYHCLTDFDDIKVDEEEMKKIFSMGLEHTNIAKAFISLSPRSLECYLLVEENQGNLMEYLEKNELNWEQRLNLASQLINGLEFLHNQQIIHPSLNPKNILLQHNTLKLTNFGGLTVFKSNDLENIPYVEPRALKVSAKSSYGKDNNSSNIYGVKSNIYSLGVLLWQVSSSLKPYKSLSTVEMVEHITNGKREEPIFGTPVKYHELYQDCWQDNPDKRPDCITAFKKLELVDVKDIISKESLKSLIYENDDDSNNIQVISQDSQDLNNKFLLQQSNLLKELKVHLNAFIHGEEILTNDGTITFNQIKQQHHTLFYTNKSSNPFELLKNECVSTQKLEEIDICLHIPLFNVKCDDFKPTDRFLRAIEEVLKTPDRKSIQKVFEKYGDYIAKDVDVGGALRIKSKWPKDRQSIMQDLDILKANLHWIIFSGNSNVFSQVPFNNIFTIEDMDGQRITSGYELKVWMEEVYEHKKVHVIAYNKIVPVYTLLKDELKQEIFKICGKLHEINIEPNIVPYISNRPIPENLEHWIKSESSPILYLCHWINSLYFHYGLTVLQDCVRHGLEVALEFLEIPEISILDKSYMFLRKPLNKKEAFTIANKIRIDDINATEIPFLMESLTNLHPIFDNQHNSNEIHCFIVSEKIKLTFNVDKLKPSEKFLKAVDEALNSNYPFRSLKNVFDKFGYFCPQSIILGITFSKVYKSDNNDQHVNDDSIDLNMDRDESKIIKDKLIEWNETVKNLDTSFFLESNDDIVDKNKIYSRLKYSHEKQNWKTVMQDLIPLYEILPKEKQSDIKNIVSDNYQIVMTGFTKITYNNQTYVNIQFENPLQDSKYEIFGCLVVDRQNVSDVMIQFNLANQYECRATIHKLDNKSVPVDAQVFWMILAKGHGYFSRNSRDIKIECGKKILTGQLPMNIEISLPKWLTSCIFVTSFDSKNFNKNQIIKSEFRHYLNNELNFDVLQYNSKELKSKMFENVTMRWCAIDTKGKDQIAVDVGINISAFFKWNILGDEISSTIKLENDTVKDFSDTLKDYDKEDVIRSTISFKNYQSDTVKDYGKGAVYMTDKVVNVVAPYIPLFDVATKLIKEIIDLHDAAQYNKNTCARLMERAIDAQGSIERLKRTKKINEERFKDQNFYNSFQRFTNILAKIKLFEEELSKIGNFKKIVEASLVKEKFINLTTEFDSTMSDLKFSIMVDNKAQRKRDFESLEKDHNEIKKLLIYTRDSVIDKVLKVVQEVQVMKSQLESRFNHYDKSADKPVFKPQQIDTSQLQLCREPLAPHNKGRVKRIYSGVIEVEFKRITLSESVIFQTNLAMIGKLGISPYILKFHGLFKIEGKDVQMIEWAELSLKDFYDRHDIRWETKVILARDICRGIVFLDSVDVFHYDIRCENIMPKITNFKLVRELKSGYALEIPNLIVLRWMAPEIMEGIRYNTKCEIFSFGMTLWELAFEKYPYKKRFNSSHLEELKKYVIQGYREKITFDPDQRPNLVELLIRIEELSEKHVEAGALPKIYPYKQLDLDGSRFCDDIEVDFEDLMLDNSDIKTIMPFEDGLKIHQQIKKNESSETITDNADMGNSQAKYWKGYYLWEGYHVEKNREEAVRLFKEAADEGVSGAQLRYAFSIISKKEKVTPAEIKEFITYLTMAADKGNHVALYNLGDLYLNGKFHVEKNRELGIDKLKLAAAYGNDKAKKLLDKLDVQ
ncbi:28476_t:CDS:10, partial [Gigaspora margarita]